MTETQTRTGVNFVHLTDEEWARASAIAKNRVDRHKGKGSKGAASLRAQEIGVAAEVAFGLAAGLDSDAVWASASADKRTPGWHYTMDGTTIRIQGTDRPGHLIERVEQAKAEVYVLAYVKPEELTVALLGWYPREELRRAETRTTSGPGWTLTSYWVRASDLLWMSRLWIVLEVAA